MKHLLEILKILDGALTLDAKKVNSYALLLAEKLEADEEKKAATSIRKTLEKANAKQLHSSSTAKLARVPVDRESRMILADERYYNLDEAKVFVAPRVSETVERFITHIQASDKLVAEGVGIAPSMLLYGPPGCGKTKLAEHIAARLDLPLLTARTDALISSYLGNTAKNLRLLFEHAMQRPCILFLDEFDAIAKLRDDKYELGELKRVVVSLLQSIDALDNKTVLLAATNHEHLLDPAIWRRFAYNAFINKPSKDTRAMLFAYFLGSFATNNMVKLLSNISEGLTGASIRQVCEEAKRDAVVSGTQHVSLSLFAPIVRQLLDDNSMDGNISVEQMVRRTRMLNSKVFTYRVLSELFGISTGKVSNILHMKE